MVNRFLGPIVATATALSPIVAQAQDETRRGIICTIPSYCNPEESSLTYTIDPGVDRGGTRRDTNGSAELNLHCVSNEGTRFTGHIHQVLEHGWNTNPLSRLENGTLYPYQLLSSGQVGYDFSCEVGEILIGGDDEQSE